MSPRAAIEIAAAVHAGGISAREIAGETMAGIANYDRVQPQAWISRFTDDEIYRRAEAIDVALANGVDLPLAGVPFAIKDNIDVAGLATTAGCPAFAFAPEASAMVVERLVAAGAIPIGKTNLDQFATGLNGTRSPYGVPACVTNRAYISGGSSSGSAVAVAAGLVPFALATDTAGSGRVPAAFNGLVGLKPSKGRWSSSGLVPACRSLDCIGVLTRTLEDARLVDRVAAGFDPRDDFSRDPVDRPIGTRIGVADDLEWFGDAESHALYAASIEAARGAGYAIETIDIGFLRDAATLLYDGAWLAERTAALETLLGEHPEVIHPVVRGIVAAGSSKTAVDAFRDLYKLQHFLRLAEAMWRSIDLLLLPTAPTIYPIAAMLADPVALNARLGLYTNWVNLLDMAALAIPAGFRVNRTGFGVTLMAPAGTDRALFDHGGTLLRHLDLAPPPPLDLETA